MHYLKTETEIVLDRSVACFLSVKMTSRRNACRGVKHTRVRFDMWSDTVAQFLSWQLQLQLNPRWGTLVFSEIRLFMYKRKTSGYLQYFWRIQSETTEVFSLWVEGTGCPVVSALSCLQAVLQCRQCQTLALQKEGQHSLSLKTALQRYSFCCGEQAVSVCLERLSSKSHHATPQRKSATFSF